MLFKQIAKDYVQCSISGVRSMNIYDLVFLFKKRNRKDKTKTNKKCLPFGRMSGRGAEGPAES